MDIQYIAAKISNATLLIDIYNAAFYDDYIKYGECPAYGRSKERMEESINKFPKKIIYVDKKPVGVISIENEGNGEYYLGCLCVIPEYQGRGIGSKAIEYIFDYYKDCNKLTLITPADKEENVAFYTIKCGFKVIGEELDGNVKVFRFERKR